MADQQPQQKPKKIVDWSHAWVGFWIGGMIGWQLKRTGWALGSITAVLIGYPGRLPQLGPLYAKIFRSAPDTGTPWVATFGTLGAAGSYAFSKTIHGV